MTTYLILALTVIIASSVVDIFRAHQKVLELEDQLENEISLRRDIKLSAIRYQRLLELAEAEVYDLKIRLDESRSFSARLPKSLSSAVVDTQLKDRT